MTFGVVGIDPRALVLALMAATVVQEIETAGLVTGTNEVAEMSNGDPFAVGLYAWEYARSMREQK